MKHAPFFLLGLALLGRCLPAQAQTTPAPQPKPQPVKLGMRELVEIPGLPGTQFAFFIQNPLAAPGGTLRSVSLYAGPPGFPREPVRLHINQVGDVNQPPGLDLLPEVVHLDFLEQVGWVVFDLRKLNVSLPPTDLFIGLEYMAGDDKYYPYLPSKDYKPIGLFLEPPCTQDDVRTWWSSYSYGADWAWKRLANENPFLPLQQALKIEVEQVKQ